VRRGIGAAPGRYASYQPSHHSINRP
jgi:hypothetical protein